MWFYFQHGLNMVNLASHTGSLMTFSYIFIYFFSFNVHLFGKRAAEPQSILWLLNDSTGTEDPIAATIGESLLLHTGLFLTHVKTAVGLGESVEQVLVKFSVKDKRINILSIAAKVQNRVTVLAEKIRVIFLFYISKCKSDF